MLVSLQNTKKSTFRKDVHTHGDKQYNKSADSPTTITRLNNFPLHYLVKSSFTHPWHSVVFLVHVSESHTFHPAVRPSTHSYLPCSYSRWWNQSVTEILTSKQPCFVVVVGFILVSTEFQFYHLYYNHYEFLYSIHV